MRLTHRRHFLHLAAGAAALPVMPCTASALEYPTRPVRIVVGFPAGGPTDFHARLIAPWLSERLGQPFVIENRSGAGGNIGTEAVVRALPDGYTLLLVNVANAFNATLYDNLTFDSCATSHRSRALFAVASLLRSAHRSRPKTIPELIAYAKANPGKVNMASGGIGTPQHVAGELFKMMTGVNMVHVPYRGEAPALADLISDHVQVMFGTVTISLPHIRTGRLRALAVTSLTRSEALPNVPTMADFVPGYEMSTWVGVAAPRGTPREIIGRLNHEINAGLDSPGIKSRYADLDCPTFATSATDFGKFMAEETEKWAKVIRAAGIR